METSTAMDLKILMCPWQLVLVLLKPSLPKLSYIIIQYAKFINLFYFVKRSSPTGKSWWEIDCHTQKSMIFNRPINKTSVVIRVAHKQLARISSHLSTILSHSRLVILAVKRVYTIRYLTHIFGIIAVFSWNTTIIPKKTLNIYCINTILSQNNMMKWIIIYKMFCNWLIFMKAPSFTIESNI